MGPLRARSRANDLTRHELARWFYHYISKRAGMFCKYGNRYRQVILFVGWACYGGQIGRWVLLELCIVFIDCAKSAGLIFICARQFFASVVFVALMRRRLSENHYHGKCLGIKLGVGCRLSLC